MGTKVLEIMLNFKLLHITVLVVSEKLHIIKGAPYMDAAYFAKSTWFPF